MTPLFSGLFPVDDIKIYYEIYGGVGLAERFGSVFSNGKFSEKTDNVIVMLHGNGEDHTIFDFQTEALSKNHYLVVVDSRGHGKTNVGSCDFTIDLMAEDLSKFVDIMNIGAFVLVGFSDGGNIGLTYAVRHPERLSHLVVSGANINPLGIRLSTRIPMTVEYFFAKLSKNKSEAHNLRYQLLSLMVNYPHIAPRLLAKIGCPVLVIEAQNELITKKHTRLIADSIKDSKHLVVPDAGHNVFGDNPDFVNKAILDFIS